MASSLVSPVRGNIEAKYISHILPVNCSGAGRPWQRLQLFLNNIFPLTVSTGISATGEYVYVVRCRGGTFLSVITGVAFFWQAGIKIMIVIYTDSKFFIAFQLMND